MALWPLSIERSWLVRALGSMHYVCAWSLFLNPFIGRSLFDARGSYLYSLGSLCRATRHATRFPSLSTCCADKRHVLESTHTLHLSLALTLSSRHPPCPRGRDVSGPSAASGLRRYGRCRCTRLQRPCRACVRDCARQQLSMLRAILMPPSARRVRRRPCPSPPP